MLRVNAAVLIATLFVACTASAAEKNFSGHWKMDAARSESAHQAAPIESITLIIRQTEKDISVETIRRGRDAAASSTETLTYSLDGSERTIPNPPGAPIKTRARWDGTKLVTETSRSVNGTPVTINHVLSIGKEGKQLTINKTLTVQHGYQSHGGNNVGTGTDIFVRASDSPRK